MRNALRSRCFFFLIAIVCCALPLQADDVTVSGNVTFASLDGSALDHDGAANGVFAVTDGSLTIAGSVTCNDNGAGSNSACPMAFVTSGNFVMLPGSSLYAENRVGGGNGGSISVNAGGNVTLQGPAGSLAGAIISSSRGVPGGPPNRAGNITLTAGGTAVLQAGSVVSAAAGDGIAGAIAITAQGVMTIGGIVAAGPTATVASTRYTGEVFSGGVTGMGGGSIRIASASHVQPAIVVTGDAIVATQGANGGTGSVTLEGCDVRVLGLVASLSRDGSGARVVVRSGTAITVDGRDVNRPSPTLGRLGVIRAESTFNGTSGAMSADLFAQNGITLYGPDPALSPVFAVSANGNHSAKDISGVIRAISLAGGISASGNAFSASGTLGGDVGGSVNVSARDAVTLDGAVVKANGDFSSTDAARAGGAIRVRSYSGAVSWQNGSGDVRPTGSAAGVPASQQGSITLTYCSSVTTSGSTFPANGSPVGTFPTLVQSCAPAAPTLPAGEAVLPTCNRPPVAVADAQTVAEGGALNVAAPGVLANDSDPDGDPITAVLVSGPAHASSFTLNPNGSFSYVHDGSETTSDSFTYKASDGSLDSNVATVSITVTPVNDAPVANNDTATVAEGGTINFAAPAVLANDTDPDGPALSAQLVSGPAHAASFALNADGSYVYVHDGSETTSDSFTYKASDGSLTSNTATVSITITPVNDAPVASADSATVAEGGTLNAAAPGVLANDSDVDSPTLTAVLVSGPAHAASFTLNANGSYTYVHDGSETTSDFFTYKASDGSLTSNTVPVTITVTPVNDAPVAAGDSATVAEGGTLTVAAPGVLGNDSDVDSASLTAVLVSGPAHAASFTLNADGSYTYVHDGSETTSDSFTYKASDGSLTSSAATVSITVTPVNDAPVAVGDSATVAEGGSTGGNVITNDSDAENDTLTASLVSGPAHAASFTLNPNGTFSYTHDGSETTSDSFTYKVSDGALSSNVATVSITVTPVNDAPVASDDAATVAEGGTLNGAVLGNDSDVDSPSLTAVLVSGPAHAASFTLNANGTFTYVHDGSETTSDSFTYKASDGSLDSNVATVSIAVTPVNDAPVAAGDSYGVAEGGTLTVAAPGVLGNDSDVDSPSLTAVLVSGPAHAASFTLNADGSFTYVHDGSETTSDSFTYKASDGSALSGTTTVTIAVTPVNDAPVANNDAFTVAEGGTLNGGVLGNDTDADSASLTATLVSGPAHAASFTFNADGTFTYVHDGSETSSDSFTYTASDGSLTSNTATVQISVTGVDDAPIAVADAYSVAEGGTLSPAAPGVLANDTDVDSASLTAVLVSGPAHAASFTLNANGSFTYVHDGSETLTDSFTYKANDGTLDSNVVTVAIAVTPVNDAPVANNDAYTVNEGDTLNVAAPGVLGNDSDADSPAFTATLISGPAHAASFTLNADGSFTYVHDGSSSTSDVFTYAATDGSATSSPATVTITIIPVNDPPVLANGSTLNYTENAAAAVINGAIAVSDPDSTTLAGATVQITGNYASGQDVLSFIPVAGISGSFNAGTGTLTLSGTSSLANYQIALRNVKYANTSDDPSTAVRTVSFQVNDGEPVNNLSNVVTSTINVTAVNDPPVATSYAALPAQASIPITYPAGKLTGTDAEAGTSVTVDTTPINVVNGTVTINANGSFTFTPLPRAATASFQYRVFDDGNPAPGVASAYATVTFAVAGPSIYFSKSVPAGLGNCTLGNECTVTTALANIGSATNQTIFIDDASTQSPGLITLSSGGSIVGQGVTAPSFDALFGIVAPAQGTLAPRPAVNQARPTLAANITLHNNSQVRGLNITTTANDALSAVSRIGLVVTDLDITSTANTAGAYAVDFASSSGTFNFGNITVSGANVGNGIYFNATTSSATATFGDVRTSAGDAVTIAGSGTTNFTFNDVTSGSGQAVDVNGASGAFTFHAINANGAPRAVEVQNATGSFTVTGTGTTAGSGGTIANAAVRGARFSNSSNVTLKNVRFDNDGANVDTAAVCGNAAAGTNTNCGAGIDLQSVTGATLSNVVVQGGKQIGLNGNGVSGLSLINSSFLRNGDELGEDGVQMVDLAGSVSVSGSTFQDNATHQFEVSNRSGVVNASVSSSTFALTNFASACAGVAPSPGNCTAGSGMLFTAASTATVNATVLGSTFTKIYSYGLRWDGSSSASGTVKFGQSGAGNTFTNNGLGLSIGHTGSGSVTYEIRDNTFSNSTAVTSTFATTPISTSFAGSGSRVGTVDNNVVGVGGTAAATGCFVAGCNGIELTDSGATGTHLITVTNNRVFHVNGGGILITSSGNGTDTMRAKVQNNTLAQPDGTTTAGIFVRDGNASPAGVKLTCLDISGNTVSGLWASGTTHKSAIRIQGSHALQFSLTNFSPSTEYAAGAVASTCTTQCTGGAGLDGNAADFLSQQNPATISAQASAGGSSASQLRTATSAAWTGTSGVCP